MAAIGNAPAFDPKREDLSDISTEEVLLACTQTTPGSLREACFDGLRRIVATILDPKGKTFLKEWVNPEMDSEKKAFYEKHLNIVEIAYPLFLTKNPPPTFVDVEQQIENLPISERQKDKLHAIAKDKLPEVKKEGLEQLLGCWPRSSLACINWMMNGGFEVATEMVVSELRADLWLHDTNLLGGLPASTLRILVRKAYANKPLHLAAAFGDLDRLKALLASEKKHEERSENEFTPLHLAALLGQKEAVELLLDSGMNINSESFFPHAHKPVAMAGAMKPVDMAIKAKDVEMLKFLFVRGGKTNLLDSWKRFHRFTCGRALSDEIQNFITINSEKLIA